MKDSVEHFIKLANNGDHAFLNSVKVVNFGAYISSQLCNDAINTLSKAIVKQHCQNFEMIQYDKPEIENYFLVMLAKALSSGNCAPSLKKRLLNCQLDFEGITCITDDLSSGHCPVGLDFNLGSNEFCMNGFKKLMSTMTSKNCPKKLKLSFCDFKNFGSEHGKMLADTLLKRNKIIRKYPTYSNLIKYICKLNALYFGNNEILSLFGVNLLYLINIEAINSEFPNNHNLTMEITEQFDTIKSIVKKLKALLDKPLRLPYQNTSKPASIIPLFNTIESPAEKSTKAISKNKTNDRIKLTSDKKGV